jgi:pyruvate/2-oxoglutarate/acetoin dehydrogenase E1 component
VPVRRLGAPFVPMPFSPALERGLLPNADAIVAAAREMVEEG